MKNYRWYNFIIGGLLILLLTSLLSFILGPLITKLLTSGDKIDYFIGLNLSFMPLTIAIVIIYKFYHRLENIKINFKQVAIGFILWFCLNLSSLFIIYIYNPESLILTFDFKKSLYFLLLSMILTPIQITAEELLFRGYLIDFLKSIKNNMLFLILASSILFALPHLANPEVKDQKLLFFASYIIMAMLLSYLRIKYKGLEYSVGIHFANNFFTINFLNYPNSPITSAPVFLLREDINPIESLINILVFTGLSVIIIHYIEKKRYIKSSSNL
ncbi:MAG: CPBP family intramembrane metalloprotease [Spirochaetaceae bacterium]